MSTEEKAVFDASIKDTFSINEETPYPNRTVGQLCEKELKRRISDNFFNYVPEKEIIRAVEQETGIAFSSTTMKIEMDKENDNVVLNLKDGNIEGVEIPIDSLIARAENEEIFIKGRLSETLRDKIVDRMEKVVADGDYEGVLEFMNKNSILAEDISIAISTTPAETRERLESLDYGFLEDLSTHSKKWKAEEFLIEGKIDEAVEYIAKNNVDISLMQIEYINRVTSSDNIEHITAEELTKKVQEKQENAKKELKKRTKNKKHTL
jgi:hypothetical protein